MKKIILVGNANTGKTTIFNSFAKTNLKVGNWLGVTTEAYEKIVDLNGEKVVLVDLPGIYNLVGTTTDEINATKYLKENKDSIIINVVDSYNLQRNLFLTLQLKEAGFKPLILVNFYNKFKKKNKIDFEKLKQELGLDVQIFDKKNISNLKDLILNTRPSFPLKLDEVMAESNSAPEKVLLYFKDNYSKVDKLLSQCYTKDENKIYGYAKIDKFLLNKWFAIPVFLLVMLTVFFITFGFIGEGLSGLVSSGLEYLFNLLLKLFSICHMPASVSTFFETAIFIPVVSVFKFCVQVLIMVLLLNVLEHSGYISRIAFILDDFLSKIGLSGKGIFTLLLGLGCATTAVPTARVIENKSAKIKTAMLTSIMPCTAKLPICSLVISVFFKENTFLIMFFIYLFCVFMLILVALILNRKGLKTTESKLLLEFPSYKKIKVKIAIRNSLETLFSFMSRIFGLVVSINVILYLLQNIYITLPFWGIGKTSLLNLIASSVSFIFAPMGLGNPLIVASLVVGLLAKELVVSSLMLSFAGNIASAFTPFSAIAFLILVLFYSPCVSTMAVIKAEYSRKIMWLTFISQFVVAYAASMIVYFSFRLFEAFNVGLFMSFAVTLITLGLAIFITVRLNKRHNKNYLECKSCGLCK